MFLVIILIAGFIAVIFNSDGDLEYDVNDYDKLLPHLMNYETLFMLGSRYNAKDWKMFQKTANCLLERLLIVLN